MMPSITPVELRNVCRAWEMNNGYAGWEEFTSSFTHLHLDSTHDEWVSEKSLHKAYLSHGWPLIRWLLKKSEE